MNGLPLKGGCQLAMDTTLVCTALWSRGAINAQMATLLPVGRWRLTIASGLSTLTIQQCRPDVVMVFSVQQFKKKLNLLLLGLCRERLQSLEFGCPIRWWCGRCEIRFHCFLRGFVSQPSAVVFGLILVRKPILFVLRREHPTGIVQVEKNPW